MTEIISINSALPKESVNERSSKATLGMILGMIWTVMGSINESYEIAGKANRTFISAGFDFIKQAASSLKDSKMWEAGGQIAGGVIGIMAGAYSLKQAGNMLQAHRNAAPQINDRIARMNELNGPQLGRQNAVAQNIGPAPQPAAARAGAIEMQPLGGRMRVNAQPPQQPGIGRMRVNAQPPRQAPQQPGNVATEAERDRQARALQTEIDQINAGQNLDVLNQKANVHMMIGQPVSQGVQGITQIPAANLKETGEVEQGVSGVMQAEQQLSQGFYNDLHGTFSSFAIAETVMQAAIAASQIR